MIRKINPISRTLGTQDEKIDALIKTVNELVDAHNSLDVVDTMKRELDDLAYRINVIQRAT